MCLSFQMGSLVNLLVVLNEILHMRFWQQMQVFGYDTIDSWSILKNFFDHLAVGAASGAISLCSLWQLLGVTEIHSYQKSLVITYKLLGMSRKVSIGAEDIQHFRQYVNKSSDSADSWDLEIVTNQRYFPEDQAVPAWLSNKWTKNAMTRKDYKKIHLYSHFNPSASEWLGSVLADF
jgi:hypothetical protein